VRVAGWSLDKPVWRGLSRDEGLGGLGFGFYGLGFRVEGSSLDITIYELLKERHPTRLVSHQSLCFNSF
jgi:hypothetical protein